MFVGIDAVAGGGILGFMIWSRLLCLGFLTSLSLEAITIKDAYTRQMETEQFQRVSEFFNGHENPGNAAILRTDDAQRDGLYVFLQLSGKLGNAAGDHHFVLEVIPSDALKALEFTFPLSGSDAGKKKQIVLGLTGNDWPSPDLQPMAWRVRLLSGETEVASWESFLWEMP